MLQYLLVLGLAASSLGQKRTYPSQQFGNPSPNFAQAGGHGPGGLGALAGIFGQAGGAHNQGGFQQPSRPHAGFQQPGGFGQAGRPHAGRPGGFGQQGGFGQGGFGQPGFVRPVHGGAVHGGAVHGGATTTGTNNPALQYNCAASASTSTYGIESTCKEWCKLPDKIWGGEYVCCENRQGTCPAVRAQCPKFGPGVAGPVCCFVDSQCKIPTQKCCFDKCLAHKVCKEAY